MCTGACAACRTFAHLGERLVDDAHADVRQQPPLLAARRQRHRVGVSQRRRCAVRLYSNAKLHVYLSLLASSIWFSTN